jgi:hypothetical protein
LSVSESFSDDKIFLLESFARHLPPAGIERDQYLDKLAHLLAQVIPNTDPRLNDLALTLTRITLFSLQEGFMLGGFQGVSGSRYFSRSLPPDAQVALEERLTVLARLPVARKEILSWALKALNGELATLLRQGLNLWGHLVVAAFDWMLGLSRRNQNPQYEFGLTLLHLLAKEEGKLWPEELDALIALSTQWVRDLPSFPEYEIRDLFRCLHKVRFSPEQGEPLASLLQEWEDTDRYPSERSFATPAEYNRAMRHLGRIEGRGKFFIAVASVLIAILGHFRPSILPIHTPKIRPDVRYGTLAIGWAMLTKSDARYLPDLLRVLRSLAEINHAEFRLVLEEIFPVFWEQPTGLKPLVELLVEEGFQRFDDLWESRIEALRPSFSRQALQIWLEQVRHKPQAHWLRQVLERVDTLKPNAAEWLATQVACEENPQVMELILKITQRLANRDRNLSMSLENALWERMRLSIDRGEMLSSGWARWLAGARLEILRQGLDLLRQYAAKDEPDDIRSYAQLLLSALAREVNSLERPEPLRLAVCWLVDPADGLRSNLPLPERLQLVGDMMRRAYVDEKVIDWLRRAIVRTPNVEDLVQTLRAGGYYVDEKDIEQLNAIIQAPDAEKFAQVLRVAGYPEWRLVKAHPRLASVFFEPLDTEGERMMRAGAYRRIALARALQYIRDPELLLPLLRDLSEEAFELAVDLVSAWSVDGEAPGAFPEFYREADELAKELLQAVASLPVTPPVVNLLREMVLAPSRIPEEGLSGTFSPAFIQSTILPLMVEREVDAEAIPLMLTILQEPLPTGERHQLVQQCILQWLSNVSTLDATQQEIIWQSGYTSPDILTRSLALLVLGRQRPPSTRTWQTILGLLNTSWIVHYIRRTLEVARMRDSFPEPNDVFLLLGTAVALSAEWAREKESLSAEQFQALHRAWRRASSDVHRLIEGLLSQPGILSIRVNYARGLARNLCDAVGESPHDDPDLLSCKPERLSAPRAEIRAQKRPYSNARRAGRTAFQLSDPDWLIRPADLARSLLQRFSLTKGDGYERSGIPSTDRRPAPLL